MLSQKIHIYHQVLKKISLAKKVAFVSHKTPDLDTIGSALWFYDIIWNAFPSLSIDLICVDTIPEKYTFLENTHLFQTHFSPSEYDLIIFFDSGSKTQTWWYERYPQLFDGHTYPTISIDHHITNERYGVQNILNTSYSSTTMILFEMALLMGLPISPQAATALLTGIYTDTGGLKHSNTSEITYLFVGQLLKLWANLSLIVEKFFKNNTLSTLKMWGKIIDESFIDTSKVLYGYVDQTSCNDFWVCYEDVYGVIDYLNMVEGISYMTLLTQKWEYIKASLRTLRDDIDLTKIAKQLWGWWHKKASGFTTKGILSPQKTFQINT